MKKSILTPILALVALALAAAIFIPASTTAIPLEDDNGGEWLITTNALARADLCLGHLDICREYCIYGEPTNEFGCFAY